MDLAYSGSQKSEVCHIPYAISPMPSRTSSFGERLYQQSASKNLTGSVKRAVSFGAWCRNREVLGSFRLFLANELAKC